MDMYKSFTQLLFSTVRILALGRDAMHGAATAFVFARQLSAGSVAPFLVTNRHVIENKVKIQFFFTVGFQGSPLIGETVMIEMYEPEEHWYFNADPDIDIAVTPLAEIIDDATLQGKNILYRSFGTESVLTQEQLEKLDCSEQICFVGYPSGLMDSVNKTPIIRRGHTATSYFLDYMGRKEFLIDAPVIPGSSGSPVLLVWEGKAAAFLGIIYAYITMDEAGEIRKIGDPKKETNQIGNSLGIGTVIKAEMVVATIEAYLMMHGHI
jgi:hypothetical protein